MKYNRLTRRDIEAYLDMAERYAQLSPCNRRKNGALVVKDGSILASGYNRPPPGWPEICETEDGSATLPQVIHAEAAALDSVLRQGGPSTQGAIMFMTTAPCETCAMRIVGAGIERIYFREEYRKEDGLNLLHRHGIPAYHYQKD